ncbi:SOS response-associated peptidase [Arthrobacter sp. Sa2CUA1]|uniref:Abasic site processing protein n=1 Tax=Arthrobacter gallicola TaxID=2762225 RepID=A0ABR8UP19_9MICC|nr:SOS response-associated peptidase [Arthrobacter gallicola]MBD7994301.1 SOS response-associated peptidase [Arthrobacter gallicola]
MCGRYVMAKAIGDLVAEAEAEADANLELRQSWNVAPTSDVPVVLERLIDGTGTGAPQTAGTGTVREGEVSARQPQAVRQVHVARWGLVPGWAKDISVGVRAFNARSETLLEKPTFRDAVLSRRCAVPMEGYYEWKTGPGNSKQPYFVHRPDGKLSWFAGLYEWWADPAVPPGDPDRWLLSTTIITLAAPDPEDPHPVLAGLGALHNRLPLPLSSAALDAWTALGTLNNTGALDLLGQVLDQAYPTASNWQIRAVDPAVGSVRNDGPWLLEPRELDAAPRLDTVPGLDTTPRLDTAPGQDTASDSAPDGVRAPATEDVLF